MAEHLLLAASVVALGGMGVRVASTASPAGLPRLLAATTLAASVATASIIVLGSISAASSSIALAAIALGAWAVTRAALPKPQVGLIDELVGAARANRGAAILIGALLGLGLIWMGSILATPLFPSDAYHLPQAIAWVQQGAPEAFESAWLPWPVGNYPLGYEALAGWMVGISGGLAPALLLTPASLLLLVGAGWSGLRQAGVEARPAVAAIAAIVALPIVVTQLDGPNNDLPAMAWLAVAATLSLHAATGQRNPALLPFAILAAALAIGIKTSVAPLAIVAIAAAAWVLRTELRSYGRQLALALLASLLIGGVWYLRNLFEHGNPLWPFVDLPFGDPIPPLMAIFDASFLDRPGATLAGRGDEYVLRIAGGLVLIGGLLVAAIIDRSRSSRLAAAGAGLALLLWMAAPVTGIVERPFLSGASLSAIRYLLPALAAAAVAIALASRPGARRGGAAEALLWSSAVVSAYIVVNETAVDLPSPALSLLGLVAGAAAAGVGSRLISRPDIPHLALVATSIGAVIAATIALWVFSEDFGENYAETGSPGAAVVGFLLERPDFVEDDQVLFDRQQLAPLAGDDIERTLVTLPDALTCPELARLRSGTWLVVRPFAEQPEVPEGLRAEVVERCMSAERPAFEAEGWEAYGPTG